MLPPCLGDQQDTYSQRYSSLLSQPVAQIPHRMLSTRPPLRLPKRFQLPGNQRHRPLPHQPQQRPTQLHQPLILQFPPLKPLRSRQQQHPAQPNRPPEHRRQLHPRRQSRPLQLQRPLHQLLQRPPLRHPPQPHQHLQRQHLHNHLTPGTQRTAATSAPTQQQNPGLTPTTPITAMWPDLTKTETVFRASHFPVLPDDPATILFGLAKSK